MSTSHTPTPDPPAPSEEAQLPPCFGDDTKVCPTDDEGIICPCVKCVSCAVQRSCLQEALVRKGILRRSKVAPVVAQVSGFIKRWSRRKLAEDNPPDSKK